MELVLILFAGIVAWRTEESLFERRRKRFFEEEYHRGLNFDYAPRVWSNALVKAFSG